MDPTTNKHIDFLIENGVNFYWLHVLGAWFTRTLTPVKVQGSRRLFRISHYLRPNVEMPVKKQQSKDSAIRFSTKEPTRKSTDEPLTTEATRESDLESQDDSDVESTTASDLAGRKRSKCGRNKLFWGLVIGGASATVLAIILIVTAVLRETPQLSPPNYSKAEYDILLALRGTQFPDKESVKNNDYDFQMAVRKDVTHQGLFYRSRSTSDDSIWYAYSAGWFYLLGADGESLEKVPRRTAIDGTSLVGLQLWDQKCPFDPLKHVSDLQFSLDHGHIPIIQGSSLRKTFGPMLIHDGTNEIVGACNDKNAWIKQESPNEGGEAKIIELPIIDATTDFFLSFTPETFRGHKVIFEALPANFDSSRMLHILQFPSSVCIGENSFVEFHFDVDENGIITNAYY